MSSPLLTFIRSSYLQEPIATLILYYTFRQKLRTQQIKLLTVYTLH